MFLLVPIVEIALFIEVGGLIGLWPTLGLVLLMAVAGAMLVRRQGVMALRRLQARLEAGGDPTGPLADGAMILIAGVLLMLPGFFTDAVGLALLLPPVRAAVIRRMAGRLAGRRFVFVRAPANVGAPPRRAGRPDAPIETEYEVLDDVPPSQRGASGWTRPHS